MTDSSTTARFTLTIELCRKAIPLNGVELDDALTIFRDEVRLAEEGRKSHRDAFQSCKDRIAVMQREQNVVVEPPAQPAFIPPSTVPVRVSQAEALAGLWNKPIPAEELPVRRARAAKPSTAPTAPAPSAPARPATVVAALPSRSPAPTQVPAALPPVVSSPKPHRNVAPTPPATTALRTPSLPKPPDGDFYTFGTFVVVDLSQPMPLPEADSLGFKGVSAANRPHAEEGLNEVMALMEANPALTLHDALNQLFGWDERAEKVSSQRSAAEQEALARHQEKVARNIVVLLRWVMRQSEKGNLVDFDKDALRTAATDWANGKLADQDAALQQAFGDAYTPPKKREKHVIEK